MLHWTTSSLDCVANGHSSIEFTFVCWQWTKCVKIFTHKCLSSSLHSYIERVESFRVRGSGKPKFVMKCMLSSHFIQKLKWKQIKISFLFFFALGTTAATTSSTSVGKCGIIKTSVSTLTSLFGIILIKWWQDSDLLIFIFFFAVKILLTDVCLKWFPCILNFFSDFLC